MALPARLKAAGRLGPRSRAFARHVWQKIAALTLGAVFVSEPGRAIRRSLARFRRPAPPPALKLGLVAHLYYIDLLPEILECRAQLPAGSRLHLTVPEDRIEQARQAVGETPDVVLHPSRNRGRDIGPFVALLNAGVFEPYDAVLKLHTKRSPHLLDGEIRRRLLFTMLAGEPHATRRLLASFENPQTGLVGWEACYRQAPPYWMGNEARVRVIAERMGVPAAQLRLGFFEGSMFWFRPTALARLRDLRLSWEDFEPEAGQLDGTLHHALERCFTIAAWADGFSVRDLDGRLM